MNLKMVSSIKDLNAAVVVLNNNLAGTASVLKRITGMSKDIRKVSDSVRSINTLGRSEKIFDDSANFADSTAGSTSGVKGSQASSASMKQRSSETTMPWFSTRNVAKGVTALAAAGVSAMPDLGTTVARAAGFYGAATLGGVNQRGLRQSVFSGLAGGITGVGDDAAVAAILTQGMYYSPGSAAFNMRVREVGGAARFLNISNPAAAQALGAVGTGPMSGNLSQYGIFTSDPKTGKDLPFDQIVKQIYNRAYGGMKVNREQVMVDIRSGFLGADLRKLLPDATQQELAANLMGRMAEGKSTNLATLTAEGNPLAAAMKIATSETSVMERFTEPMLEGFNKSAEMIETTNKLLEKYMPEEVAYLKAILQAIGGSNLGGASTILATGAASFLGGMLGGKGVKGTLKSGGKFLGRAGLAGLTYTGLDWVQGKLNQLDVPDAWRAYGNYAFDVAQGGLTGLAAGGPVAGLVGLGAGAAGAVTNPYGGGGGRTGFGASFGARGGGSVQSPAPGMSPTTGYGAKDNSGIWSGTNNTHKGQDYPMPIGSDVQAAMDGVVFDDAPGFEYGITVQIDHENGYQSLYGHLSKSLVRPGERVKKGQVIGKSGDTGNVTGPHLHFEVRKGANNPVDPGQLMSAPFSGAGALMAYSSQDSSGTEKPQTVADLIKAMGSSSTASSSSSSSGYTPNSKPGIEPGASKKEWITSFLTQVGAPVTKDNIYAMSEWIRFESGNKWNRWNNPLNTTLDRPGAKSMNPVGVKKYAESSQGLEATIATLTGNRAKERGYTAVIDALKSGGNYTEIFDAIKASAWMQGEKGRSPYQFNYDRGPKGGGRTGFGASVSTSTPNTVNNNVSITVQVQNASDDEAMRFAKTVKRYLENDMSLKTMGNK